MRTDTQMFRIHTGGRVTFMQYQKCGWDWSVESLVRKSMRALRAMGRR